MAISAGGQVTAVWEHGYRNSISNGEKGCCYNDEIETVTGSTISGDWQSPLRISTPGFNVFPDVALDAQGDAATVWFNTYPQDGAVEASYRSQSSGKWEPPVVISAPAELVEGQGIFVEPDGDAVTTWSRRAEGSPPTFAPEVAVRPAASGVWQAPQEFGAGHLLGAVYAFDAQGDLFAARVSEGMIKVAEQPADSSSWQAPVGVPASAPPGARITVNGLIAAENGEAVVLWRQETGGCARPTGKLCTAPITTTLESSVHSASTGQWSEPAAITSITEPQETSAGASPGPGRHLGDEDIELAIDPRGDAVVAWAQVEESKTSLRGSIRAAEADSWPSPAVLSPETVPFGLASNHLAIDDAGVALAAWGEDGVVQAAVGSAATGRWQPTVNLTPEESGAAGSDLAVNAAGDAVLVWDTYPHTDALTFNLSKGLPGYRPPAPTIADARITNTRLRVHRRTPARRPPIETRFRFRLDTEALIKLAIDRLTAGRSRGKACVQATSRPRAHGARCYVRSVITTLTSRVKQGINTIPFSGEYLADPRYLYGTRSTSEAPAPHQEYLRPGMYAAILTASNTSGSSAPVTLQFTVDR